MARTTPIVIATGVTALVANTILKPAAAQGKHGGKPSPHVSWDDIFRSGRIIPGTVVAAIGFALLEKLNQKLAVGLAWTMLATVIVFPPKGSVSPAGALATILGYNTSKVGR